MQRQKFDTPKKNASSTKNTDTEVNKSKRGLVKGPKPLQKLKFYLDVKNHAVTTKLEEKIKELGGAVEFFLDREVTHVISDRPKCQLNQPNATSSPSTPLLRSVESNISNESPVALSESPAVGRLRQKTRADAMLERVRSQSTNKVRDPLQNAFQWGIPIWDVNKVFLWLEKISASIVLNTQKNKKIKILNITTPFLKFESTSRNARPVYKSIKSWPVIDLEAKGGKSAFFIENSENNKPESKNKKLKKDQVQPEEKNLDEHRMTRKQRTRLSVRGAGKDHDVDKQALAGGFCEICHCDYRELSEHVRSEQHLNFIKNDANFLELDSLISAGANVEAFLRLNGTSGKDQSFLFRRSLRKHDKTDTKQLEKLPPKCNGTFDEYSSSSTRNKMPRTRSFNSPLSPTGSENGHHHLRSRRNVINYSSNNSISSHNNVEEETIGSKIRDKERASRNSVKYSEDDKKDDIEDEKRICAGKPKKCSKTKRVSADERLVADNKTYYKVEVMTTKLRSSGLGTRETELIRRTQTPVPEESNPEEQGLVVKFKRVRRSELSVLNDEAENFMFPRKEDLSFSDYDTEFGPNTSKSTTRTDSSEIRSSESDKKYLDQYDESSLTSNEEFVPRRGRRRNCVRKLTSSEDRETSNSVDNLTDEIGMKRRGRSAYKEIDEDLDESSKDGSVACESESSKGRRRRRTHAEVFISDNQRYYKFETPGSRLRYQGMFFPSSGQKQDGVIRNNGECSEQKDEIQDEIKPKMPKDELKFSFEMLPINEPWYQTFKRQDDGEIFYSYTSDSGFCSDFIMPYQIPILVPLNPKLCIEEYHRKKQLYLKNAAISEQNDASSCQATDQQSVASTATLGTDDSTNTSLPETENSNQTGKLTLGRKRKRKSRFTKSGGSHPRKSPRQHASTLAILSSLIHQRKKRERKSHGESDTSQASLTLIPEEDLLNISRLSEEDKQKEEQNKIKEEEEAEKLTKAINEILNTSLEDIAGLEPPEEDIEDLQNNYVELKFNEDCIDLIQNYNRVEPKLRFRRGRGRGRYPRAPRLIPIAPLNSDLVRNIRRKRKKNRTGWPKKKRLIIKKSDQKDEQETTSIPELEDSRLTEMSVDMENGELEMCELDDRENSCDRTSSAKNDSDLSDISDNEDNLIIQGVENLNKVNCIVENSSNNELSQIINNNSENSDLNCSQSERNNGVLLHSVTSVPEISTNKKTPNCTDLSLHNKVPNVTTKPNKIPNDTSVLHETKSSNQELSSMIKVSVSTDFSTKVAASTKKSDTVYSVTILDCKKSVVDAKSDETVKDKWENADKVLHYQPFVRMQKLDNNLANRRLRSSTSPSPERKPKKRAKIAPPTSPRSPRKLRAPRGKWYRER